MSIVVSCSQNLWSTENSARASESVLVDCDRRDCVTEGNRKEGNRRERNRRERNRRKRPACLCHGGGTRERDSVECIRSIGPEYSRTSKLQVIPVPQRWRVELYRTGVECALTCRVETERESGRTTLDRRGYGVRVRKTTIPNTRDYYLYSTSVSFGYSLYLNTLTTVTIDTVSRRRAVGDRVGERPCQFDRSVRAVDSTAHPDGGASRSARPMVSKPVPGADG